MLGQEMKGEVIASTDVGEIKINTETQSVIGDKRYYGNNHLGNNSVTFTDRKIPESDGQGGIDYSLANITYFAEYYPYGMILRDGGDIATYTFQEQEVDNSVKGNGNSVNYKYRMHDPRVGRFFAVDPLASEYPELSPYGFSGNRVIDAIELEGLEHASVHVINVNNKGELVGKGLLGTPGAHHIGEYFLENTLPLMGLKSKDFALNSHVEVRFNLDAQEVERVSESRASYVYAKRKKTKPSTLSIGPLVWMIDLISTESGDTLIDYDNSLFGSRGMEKGMKLMFSTWGAIISGGTLAAGTITSTRGSAFAWGSFVNSVDDMTAGDDGTLLTHLFEGIGIDKKYTQTLKTRTSVADTRKAFMTQLKSLVDSNAIKESIELIISTINTSTSGAELEKSSNTKD